MKQEIFDHIKKNAVLPKKMTIYKLGSLAREEDTIHDIDFLIVVDDIKREFSYSGRPLLDYLYIPGISMKVVKSGFKYARIKMQYKKVKFESDVFITNKHGKPYMLVHFIGPTSLSISLKKKAQKKGLKYINYDIINAKSGKSVPGIVSQRDIFDLLGKKWIAVKDRKNWDK